MKYTVLFSLILLMAFSLWACQTPESGPVETLAAETTTMEIETPEPAVPNIPSPLQLPDVAVEDVITYFAEVCLAAEYVISGDPSRLQRWEVPILYALEGTPTGEDLAVLEGFGEWLNTVEGFPGIRECDGEEYANLRIHFCTHEELLAIMGNQFYGMDGAVTFWYEEDAIYDAVICIRTDIDQALRNSVILEELYNGLGPIQDTALRPGSIIYAGFSQPQALTEIDELILRLLYHPKLRCGMTREECGAVIRELYQ